MIFVILMFFFHERVASTPSSGDPRAVATGQGLGMLALNLDRARELSSRTVALYVQMRITDSQRTTYDVIEVGREVKLS